MNDVYPETGKTTFWASSIGFLSVTLGFHLGTKGFLSRLDLGATLIKSVQSLNFQKLFVAVIAAQALAQLIRYIIPYGSSLGQIEVYISGISLAITLALSCHYFVSKEKRWLFFLFFLYLFANSFYSYFSSWRIPLSILIMASLLVTTKFGFNSLLRQLPIISVGFVFVFVWQSVKGEYREFLSQGERTQAIRVTQSEALSKFSDLAGETLLQDTVLSDKLVSSTYKRIGYSEYFASAMSKVPEEIPFQQGALLQESVSFALIPRFLNPNKGVKNDRAKVERFTNFYFGSNSFSSFSLGHYCEAYIDWGARWMHLHLLIYGLFGAGMLKMCVLRTRHLHPLIKWGVALAVLSGWGTFQQDMVTVLGRCVWGSFCHLYLFMPIYTRLNNFCIKS